METCCFFLFVPPLIWMLTVVLRWRWQRQPIEGARCGRCGYPAVGLPTEICPECGSDLRVVGTTIEQGRFGERRWQRFLVWGALLVLATLQVHFFFCILFPKGAESYVSDLAVKLQSNSGEYEFIHVYLEFSDSGTAAHHLHEVSLLLFGTPKAEDYSHYLYIGFPCPDIEETRDAVLSPCANWPVSEQRLLTWMGAAGVNTSVPEVRQEVDELLVLLGRVVDGRDLLKAAAYCRVLRPQPMILWKRLELFGAVRPGLRWLEVLTACGVLLAGILYMAYCEFFHDGESGDRV